MRTDVVWQALQWPSIEHVRLESSDDGSAANGWTAAGTMVAVLDGRPACVSYRISVARDGTTRALDIHESVGGASLSVHGDGRGQWWSADGVPRPGLDGCIDVDISTTPLTNTLPVRRLALAVGDSAEITVGYVDVPSMSALSATQRYTRLDKSTYRYASGSFAANVSVDSDGVVTTYDGLWSRAQTGNAAQREASS